MKISDDPGFAAQVSQLSRDRESSTLRDLTAWDWDRVHVFYEGQPAERIEEAVGEPVIDTDYVEQAGALLVFTRGDEVVHVTNLRSGAIESRGRVTFSSDVRLVPWGSGSPAFLRLTMPGEGHASR